MLYSYSNCQSMLPATGAPVSRHRTSKMKEMFDEYVRTRTRENWKFWIVSFFMDYILLFNILIPVKYIKFQKSVFLNIIISSVYC